jgi:hypothetical protein
LELPCRFAICLHIHHHFSGGKSQLTGGIERVNCESRIGRQVTADLGIGLFGVLLGKLTQY